MAGKVFSDIYTESARDTGDQTTAHITYVKKKVNDALRDICAEMNYSWLQRSASMTLTASTAAYTISSIASTWDEDTPIRIFYRDSANKRLYLDPYDDNEWEDEEDTDEGDVYGFNISKKSGSWKATLVYVPSSAFVSSYSPLTMEYQKYPTELSADGDIPEIPTSQHQGLVYWTNKLICVEMGDAEGALAWASLAEKSIGLLKKKQVHRLGRSKRVYPRTYLGRGNARPERDYNL